MYEEKIPLIVREDASIKYCKMVTSVLIVVLVCFFMCAYMQQPNGQKEEDVIKNINILPTSSYKSLVSGRYVNILIIVER